ncbi:XapX domain-containing protein [Thalassobacillus hwangdonensis]|uniref:XapX domain-containing protein n=1 Tax=Thalassobacillus hwangdonensis TaxID=546108 RepID=A0ABW3L3T3_9BACI
MKEIIFALITGFIVGFLFAGFKLPIPAPPAFAGVVGIVGIYLGFKAFTWIGPMLSTIFK